MKSTTHLLSILSAVQVLLADKSCDVPRLPAFTEFVTERKLSYVDQSVLRYKCTDGYSFAGDGETQHKIMCQDGAWQPRKLWKCVDGCKNSCGSHGHCETTVGVDNDTVESLCQCDHGYAGKHCNAKICELPVLPEHMRVQLTTGHNISGRFSIGSMVHYTCERGYHIRKGASFFKCESDGWYPSQLPQCEAIVCKNPLLGNRNPGLKYDPMKTTYKQGDVVDMNCNGVFKGRTRCLPDGSWSTSWPNCAVYCPQPPIIGHGRVVIKSTPFKDNSMVNYDCKYGYVLTGPSNVFCLQGMWSTPPRCISWYNYCMNMNQRAALTLDKKYSCVDNIEVSDRSTSQPLTVVTATAGGLLLLLLLLITAVACQRRRLARNRRRQMEDERCSFVYYSNDVHLVLPSYDEAMRNHRPPQPPPYLENGGNGGSDSARIYEVVAEPGNEAAVESGTESAEPSKVIERGTGERSNTSETGVGLDESNELFNQNDDDTSPLIVD